MSSIHGHEVLNMMIDSGESFSTASLIAAIEQRFGADARFHTCSQQDLTAAQLVDFLASRGKSFLAITVLTLIAVKSANINRHSIIAI